MKYKSQYQKKNQKPLVKNRKAAQDKEFNLSCNNGIKCKKKLNLN